MKCFYLYGSNNSEPLAFEDSNFGKSTDQNSSDSAVFGNAVFGDIKNHSLTLFQEKDTNKVLLSLWLK